MPFSLGCPICAAAGAATSRWSSSRCSFPFAESFRPRWASTGHFLSCSRFCGLSAPSSSHHLSPAACSFKILTIKSESPHRSEVAANVRNFCIIAHIDHGKTTLSDRLLELTKTIEVRDLEEQALDAMDLERERGITIRMHPVTLNYRAKDGNLYQLNLIDTPGHVDFSYEVSRSLAACEGALLIIDAAQGIEAQTLANYHLALEHDLTIIPVINKIDLPAADPERVMGEVEELLIIEKSDCILASAKQGIGIEEILEAIVHRIPPPKGHRDHLRGLVFNAQFDPYRGVVSYVRVVDGQLRQGTKFMSMAHQHVFECTEVGIFTPQMRPVEKLGMGGVGYVIANIKSLGDIDVGDTVTQASNPAHVPLPGYRKAVPMCIAASIRTKASSIPICGTHWRSSNSTTRPLRTSRRRRLLSASDSAAGFSVCCTWKSCRSASSATTRWISLRPRRRWCF